MSSDDPATWAHLHHALPGTSVVEVMRYRGSVSRLERGMLARARRGEVLEFPSTSGGRRIPAVVVAWLVSELTRDGWQGRPFHLRGPRITGFLDLSHVTLPGQVVFEDCLFEEPIDLTSAEGTSLIIRNAAVPGMHAKGMRLRGDLEYIDVCSGAVDLFGANIGGQLWLTGTTVTADTADWAISAPSLVVAGGLYGRGLIAEGGVNLWGADIGASLELDAARLTADGRAALRADNLTVRLDMRLSGPLVVDGGIDMFGASIGGQLWLADAQIGAGNAGWAINAPGLTVSGGMYAHRLTTRGGVNLWGADIGAGIELDGATLTAEHGPALRAPGLSVNGDIHLTAGCTVTGQTDLSDTTVTGTLTITDTTLISARQPTLNLTAAHLTTVRLGTIHGHDLGVDLRGATITTLHDEPESWPQTLWLDRLSYTNLLPYLPGTHRLRWLGRDLEAGRPDAYQQLAGFYRRAGQDHEARTVLLAKHRRLRRELALPAKLWGYLQDTLVGYGYRPIRAFTWLTALIATLAAYTTLQPPQPASTSSPSFNPLAYAADVVLPILNLGQEQTYQPTGPGQWIAWTATLTGWILTTAVLTAATRTIARE